MKLIRNIMKGVLVVPAIALLLSGCTPPNPSEDVEITPEVIAALTPSTDTYVCPTDDNGLVTIKVAKATKIKTGDGYGPSLSKEMTPEKLKQRLCEYPVDGVVFGHWLAHLKIGDWSPIDEEANAHLKQFLGDPADPEGWNIIDERVRYYAPLIDVKDPSDEQVRVAIERNLEWKDVASKLASLIDHLEELGVFSELSVLNYHGKALVDGLRPVGINREYQEDLPAYTFTLTNKIGQCVLRIGWNVKDGRFEQFDCKKPAPTPKATKTPPQKVVKEKCKKNCTTPKPKCEPPLVPNDNGKCVRPKSPKDDVKPPQGVTKKGPGKKTDGKESSDQKSEGKTKGNVTDNTTSSDAGSSATAPGAKQGSGSDSHEEATKGAAKDDTSTAPPKGEVPPPGD